MKFGVGQPVRRTEDRRFVTGHGQYTDDIVLDGQAHAAFVRSPHAHAVLRNIDVSAARAAPGVLAVLTQDDVAEAGPMPDLAPLEGRGGNRPKKSPKTLLAKDKVRFVGEAVAMVVAESPALARDAAELVAVDYDPLDAAGSLEAAPDSPQIWDGAPGNLCFDWEAGDKAATDAAFARAAHVVALDLVQNRVSANPMEPRGANGVYDPASDAYTLYSGNQGSTGLRERIAKFILKVPLEKLRVISPDVGGGFGMKGFAFPEQALVLLAAKAVGRPVKWMSDRTEGLLADCHGRDTFTHAEMALDAEGRILALRLDGTANMGAYLSQYGPFIPTLAGGRILGGLYRVPAVHARVRGYFSNTAPIDAYRGAGRPEAAYLIERLMDAAAAELRVDRIELRRRNLPGRDELPYRNWLGLSFDSGDFARNIEDAVRNARLAEFETRKRESAARGKLRGLGVAYYVEITAAVGVDPAKIRFTDNGGVEVLVGTQSNGQGHETAFAQLVAEKLGVPFEAVTVRQGDTDFGVEGFTGGSRSLNMSGGAVLAASDVVVATGRRAAAQLHQAPEEDVTFRTEDGRGAFHVARTGESIGVTELAVRLKRETLPGFENGLDSEAAYKGGGPTFPNGCHICEVEVDPETGGIAVVSYHVVDDFGKVINPLLVAGQVQGGIAQGLGQVLMENVHYDASGQCLTATFMDYAMPRAEDMPDIDFAYNEIPTSTHELGAKGCGEAGTVGALPALVSAIADALGVAHIDMPATPERVWRALAARGA